MAHHNVPGWPEESTLMLAPFDPALHREGSVARQGRCLWGDHDAPAEWSAVWSGERWAVCSGHLPDLARAELRSTSEEPSQKDSAPVVPLQERFRYYLLADVEVLKRKGYNPTEFLRMVQEHGAAGAAHRLLADPRHTSDGFQRLWEMGELERSVEFAACLPWFRELFTDGEVDEAEQRLVLHDVPFRERLAAREATPPAWAAGD